MKTIQDWFINNNINTIQTSSELYYSRTIEILDKLSEYQHKPKYILDFGCGYGYNTCLLSKYFPKAKIDAIDYGKENVNIWKKINKEINSKIKFSHKDVRHTNLSTKKYDVIIMWGLLEHIGEEKFSRFEATTLRKYAKEQETLCLKEVYRILKDDGLLMINYLPNEHSWIEKITKHTNIYSHKIKFTPNEIFSLLRKNNFLPEQVNYAHFFPSLYFFAGKGIGKLLNYINPLVKKCETLIYKTHLVNYSQDLEIIARKK